MIVPMMKYDFVLHYDRYEDFLERLRELGLVDITTTGWEPSEDDRQLLVQIEQHRQAARRFEELTARKEFVPGEPFATGEEAFERYREAAREIESLTARIARTRKEADELAVWGAFSPDKLTRLEEAGVELRFFSAYDKDFGDRVAGWRESYLIEEIASRDGVTYFVAVVPPGTDVAIDAQEMRRPEATRDDKRREAESLEKELEEWNRQLARCVASQDAIAEHEASLRERLRFRQVHSSGRAEADGSLVLLEGWATRETADRVDAMLEEYPDLFYLKSDPTPDDDTPVLLKNNRFARLFELIGGFYSLPRYGTMDLTPYFGPFYMIFFGFCLGDGGYGLIFVLAGLLMRWKGGPKLRQAAGLTVWCGAATVLFGLLTGSFFGVQLAGLPLFAQFREYFLSSEKLFNLAIALGLIQILFGMALKVTVISRQFGFRYALSTIGWMIVIVSTLAAMFLPDLGIRQFSMGSAAYLACLGAGLFMMLFLNSPDKNPLANFGAGLWNTYNDVTGLMSDVLSYIRLFAIGLSGGVLALVFNDLALGLSPDIPVVGLLVTIIILLIGHGINLFMSSLGSFVHPMRLTFVEFYKNAGFEGSQRPFEPFRHNKHNDRTQKLN